jgi:ABC-type transporter Mla subunit MlaD
MPTPRTNHFTDHGHERATILEDSQARRNERFDACLNTVVALIRRLAADKAMESAIALSRLSEVISGSPDPINMRCLLPAIRTALATRIEALIELQYGDLDTCLESFAENLRGLNAGKALESLMGLQQLREHIKERGEGQPSRWLLGSIDAVLGKKVAFLQRPHYTEYQRREAHPS